MMQWLWKEDSFVVHWAGFVGSVLTWTSKLLAPVTGSHEGFSSPSLSPAVTTSVVTCGIAPTATFTSLARSPILVFNAAGCTASSSTVFVKERMRVRTPDYKPGRLRLSHKLQHAPFLLQNLIKLLWTICNTNY